MDSNEPDPISYLIAEFEAIILRLAREIDQLRKKVRDLEAAEAGRDRATR